MEEMKFKGSSPITVQIRKENLANRGKREVVCGGVVLAPLPKRGDLANTTSPPPLKKYNC